MASVGPREFADRGVAPLRTGYESEDLAVAANHRKVASRLPGIAPLAFGVDLPPRLVVVTELAPARWKLTRGNHHHDLLDRLVVLPLNPAGHQLIDAGGNNCPLLNAPVGFAGEVIALGEFQQLAADRLRRCRVGEVIEGVLLGD